MIGPCRPFRFGIMVETAHDDATAWVSGARRAEQLGYATYLVRDHFVADHFGPQLAPLPALAAAAAATTSLRVGTLVLANDYRHPVLLAKEAATLDVLSGGRLELGLGAGWLESEYARAGLPFDRPGLRVARLTEALQVLKGLFGEGPLSFSGAHYRVTRLDGYPKPVQRPHPPILVGAGSERMLRLAGREADIVGILTASTRTGTLVSDPGECLAEAVARKLGWVRAGAAGRPGGVELSLIATPVPARNRAAGAEDVIRQRAWQGVEPDAVLAMPAVLIGDPEAMVDALQERRERFGFSYWVVSDRHLEAFAPVVARLAGR
jgi:probable F420-dependent oxidoreductase